MSSVDNRIVNMHFNSRDFIAGATNSSEALQGLEETIQGMGNTGGLEDMGSSIDGVASKFGALQVAGVAALATIASKATSTALGIGKDLLGSITSTVFGAGADRAIALEQARFQFRGLGLDVKEVMANALTAVEGTAFGLQEAASIATQFGGSGVKAGKEMTTSLRAISGVAAQTGRSYSEIGQIFTGIAGVGRVTTQDLLQFGVRGLDVTGALAEQMGVTQDKIRQMVTDGQINFKEFSTAMDEAFGENAAKANRTFTGALANMKASLSRIGADFFAPLLKSGGDVLNSLQGFFGGVQDQLGPVSEGFGKLSQSVADVVVKFLDGLKVAKVLGPIFQGIKNIMSPLVAIFTAVGEAFSQVFPVTGKDSAKAVYTIADAFELLTRPLAWIAEQIPKITPILEGFFSVIKYAFTDVKNLGAAVDRLIHTAGDIGSNIIQGITSGLDAGTIQAEIVNLANNIIDWIKSALGIASPASELIPVGVAIIEGIVEGIADATIFLFEALGKLATAVISGIGNLFGDMDAIDWAALFNAILAGGVLLAIRSFIKTLDSIVGTVESFTKSINAPFALLTDTLKTMQTQVRAQLILSIAIAVGVLTASIVALSLIEPKKLATGLGGLALMMGILIGAMALLSKVDAEGLVAISASILLISTAMLILSGAVAALGNMDLSTLAKGLGAIAVGLGIMVVALQFMVGLGPGLPAAAFAIVIMASAMTIMASAVALLGNMDMGTLAKGLGSMAIGLGIFVTALGALTLLGPGVAASGAGILIVAGAMVIMAGAVATLGNLDMSTLAKGLGAIAIGLTLFVVALGLLTGLGPTVIIAAESILIMSAAMLVMATAMGIIGDMSLGDIAKALGALAVGFTILLLAAAGAIAVAPGLIVLGSAVAQLGLGLALAGAGLLAAATAFSLFAAVGTAGIAVILAGLSGLIALLPVFALQLATSFTVFIQAIAEAAPKLREAFGTIIREALGTIRDAMPELRKLINEFVNTIFKIVRNNHKEFAKTLELMIRTGLQVIRNLVPDFVDTGIAIIMAFLRGIRQNIDEVIDMGTQIIIKIIRGIGDGSEDIVKEAGKTIRKFVNALPAEVEATTRELSTVGLDIARAIAQGIYDGLITEGKVLVGQAAVELADSLPYWMKKVLGIDSPSKVAIYWGEMIVAGLVKGITDNIKYAVGAAIQLANAVVAAGDKVVAKAQREATKRQIAAEKVAARARIADQQARAAEKRSRQADKKAAAAEKEAGKSPKNKELQAEADRARKRAKEVSKAANEARKEADRRAKAAQQAQAKADKADQKVSDTQAFRSADDQGKGDILTERAQQLSDRAVKLLAQANEEAKAAKKAQGKERKRLLKAARQDAKAAKELADKSKAAQKRAAEFYAQSVLDRIKAIEDVRAKELEEIRLQEELDNATDAGKAEILQARADAAQARADAAESQALALIEQAKKLAKTNAVKAQRLLDRAEVLAQEARDAADEAERNEQQAQQYADQANNPNSSGTSFQLSRSAMEDAASAIDRYTKSLQQSEEAAAAATPVYQFVQNNNSPESLSDTEIYRQTRNLLSAAEIKMGVPA